MSASTSPLRSPRHGKRDVSPLSARTRRRLLADLHRRALDGDVTAAGELIRIGMAVQGAPDLSVFDGPSGAVQTILD